MTYNLRLWVSKNIHINRNDRSSRNYRWLSSIEQDKNKVISFVSDIEASQISTLNTYTYLLFKERAAGTNNHTCVYFFLFYLLQYFSVSWNTASGVQLQLDFCISPLHYAVTDTKILFRTKRFRCFWILHPKFIFKDNIL